MPALTVTPRTAGSARVDDLVVAVVRRPGPAPRGACAHSAGPDDIGAAPALGDGHR